MEIGNVLKEEREARGISLAEAEEATKIRKKYLDALEKESFDVLPGRIYVKGFLRNYARFLELDGEMLVTRYDEQYPEHETGQALSSPTVAPPRKREKNAPAHRTFYRIAGAALVVALVAGAGWLSAGLGGKPHNAPQQPGTKPPVTSTAPAPPASAPGAADKQAQGVNLVLNVVKDSCWMQVVVDGNTQFTGELTANQSRTFQGQKNIRVKLGNAGVVNVQYNGRDVGTLGSPGQVVTKDFSPAKQG